MTSRDDITTSRIRPSVRDLLYCCWTPGWHTIHNEEWSGIWELVCACGAQRFSVHRDAVDLADRTAAEMNRARSLRFLPAGRNAASMTLGEVLCIDGELEPHKSRAEFVSLFRDDHPIVAAGFRRWLSRPGHDRAATLDALLDAYRATDDYKADLADANAVEVELSRFLQAGAV